MAEPDPPKSYATIRDTPFRHLIGATCVEITQHDQEEWEETKESRIYLHFDNGMILNLLVTESGVDLENVPDEEAGEDGFVDGRLES